MRAAVEFVTAEQFADPKTFNAEKYWLVVLPYGSYFPMEARENFLAYLRAGGDFLSTGGYAFDDRRRCEWKGQWLTLEDALRHEFRPRRSRSGREQTAIWITLPASGTTRRMLGTNGVMRAPGSDGRARARGFEADRRSGRALHSGDPRIGERASGEVQVASGGQRQAVMDIPAGRADR